jgi:hypothetical protein
MQKHLRWHSIRHFSALRQLNRAGFLAAAEVLNFKLGRRGQVQMIRRRQGVDLIISPRHAN